MDGDQGKRQNSGTVGKAYIHIIFQIERFNRLMFLSTTMDEYSSGKQLVSTSDSAGYRSPIRAKDILL
jgi:hypothetical protein